MPYSLVGAHALGFDLARLERGHQVAAVLRTALAADATDLDRLAAQHPGTSIRAAWQRPLAAADAEASTTAQVLPLAAAALEEAAGGTGSSVLRRLESSLLGDARALDRFVRHEILDWTWLRSGSMAVQDPTASAAADVLVDAALGGFLGDRLDADLRRAMATAFVRSGVTVRDRTAPTGSSPVDGLLDLLAAGQEPVRRAWRRVVDEQRRHTAQWAPAMHQATWAVSMADRLRMSCDVQLAGVLAFHAARLTARDAAYGVWNAISGVLQASTVGDLLPAEEADVLLRPWLAVYGSGAIPDPWG